MLNPSEDIKKILHQHYMHPEKLELNVPYLVLHAELLAYIKKVMGENENEKEC